MSFLALKNVSVRLGGRPVIDGLDLQIEKGEFVGLIGPNGAGKSTLMRAIVGLTPATGTIAIAGEPAATLDPRERARRIAYLAQNREIAWPIAVEEVVALGRTPHRHPFAPLGPADLAAIDRAIDTLELAGLRRRRATELSGGETARVALARALAQEADLVIADEPAAGLDPSHQIGLTAAFSRLAAEGHAVIASLHELGLAARWCHRLVLLDHGRIVADGTPQQVLTPENLAAVYGINVHLTHDAGGLIVAPTGLTARPGGGAP